MIVESEKLRKLRHDISNPLAAVLAETQLLLLDADALSDEVVTGLRQIETLARKMRGIIQDTDV